MILISGPVLPLLALVWPLLLAAVASVPVVRAHALRLLPLAPLPALALPFPGQDEGPVVTEVPDLLLGVVLAPGREGALLCSMTAALWLAAGLLAPRYMAHVRRPAVFSGFWCVTLAGNLGVFLAGDVITFYASFAAVSLCAYFLVVTEGTDKALRAGRIYLVLAVAGEACLIVAFMIGAAAADSLLIADIRQALGAAPLLGIAGWLLVAGFGVKAGLMPLHMWLPLAHPAAPTPASAVLSGAIVKAGVIGLVLFLPPALPVANVLLVAGLAGAFAAALLGLSQRHPKAILAYSTISQMGLVLALIGAAVPEGQGFAAAAYYATHHGLAKGALFLCVALVGASGGRWRWAALALAGMAAVSVAGLPVSGGALAKAAAKHSLPAWAELAVTFSGATTTLVLGWFLLRLSAEGDEGPRRPPAVYMFPAAALILLAQAVPWFLWQDWAGLPSDYPLRPGTLWAALWPVVLGIGAILLLRGVRIPILPEGDIVVFPERMARRLIARVPAAEGGQGASETFPGRRFPGLDGAGRLELLLQRSGWGTILAVVALLAIALTLI